MLLVSDILDPIGRIYSPLNLANIMKIIQKLEFFQNTALDNHILRVLNFIRNPELCIFLLSLLTNH